MLEEVALGLQQTQALRAQLEADALIRRRERAEIAQQAVDRIAEGVSVLPQERGTAAAVAQLHDLVAAGKVEVRAYLRSPLHAKAYLCWYADHAEPGAAVVGSSNLTLAGFTGNTELNVRVTGDAEMAALREWFDALWADAADISKALVTELERSWVLAKTPPYHVYLKALYELYSTEIGGGPLPAPPRTARAGQLSVGRREPRPRDDRGLRRLLRRRRGGLGQDLYRRRSCCVSCSSAIRTTAQAADPLPRRIAVNVAGSQRAKSSLGAEVVSHSMIAAPPEAEFDEELGRYIDMPSNLAGASS